MLRAQRSRRRLAEPVVLSSGTCGGPCGSVPRGAERARARARHGTRNRPDAGNIDEGPPIGAVKVATFRNAGRTGCAQG